MPKLKEINLERPSTPTNAPNTTIPLNKYVELDQTVGMWILHMVWGPTPGVERVGVDNAYWWSGTNKSTCQILWIYVQQFLHRNGLCFKNLGYRVPHSLRWEVGSPPQILHVVSIWHCATFISSSYNGWSIDIMSIKKRYPLEGRVGLTSKNLALVLSCYHAKLDGRPRPSKVRGPKCNHFVVGPIWTYPDNFVTIRPRLFQLSCLKTNKQETNKLITLSSNFFVDN